MERAQPLLDAHDNEGGQALVDQARSLDPNGSLQHSANVLVQAQAALLKLRRGDSMESARLALSALAMAIALDQPRLQAHARLAVTRASLAVGDVDNALSELEMGWTHVQGGDDLALKFWYETNFGIAHFDLDQFEEAVEWFRQAATTAQEIGASPLIALGASNLCCPWVDIAERAYASGDREAATLAWQTALDTARVALPLVEGTNIRMWIATTVMNHSAALGGLGHKDEALAGLSQACELGIATGNLDFLAKAHFNKAKVMHRNADISASLGELKLAIEVGVTANSRATLMTIYEFASDVAEQSGDYALALVYSRRHHDLYVEAAADRAAMRSKLLAVRLATERAQAEANAERLRRIALSKTYRALEVKAESLHHEATHDMLTGLFNRRELNHYLDISHAEAISNHRRLYLAMLDIDHFKSINDQYSHMVGDRVLKQMGSLLNIASRDRDFAARFGGEEFVVVMGDVKPLQAAMVAERLRQSIQEFDWTSVAAGLHVTASFGVYNIAKSPDAVSGMAQADRLLYKAKDQGRNRVVSDDPAE